MIDVIHELISESEAVTAIVGDRIYHGDAPQDVTISGGDVQPYIHYFQTDFEARRTLSGSIIDKTVTIEVHAYTRTEEDFAALSQALFDLLDNAESDGFQYCSLINEFYESRVVDDEESHHETQVYRVIF
jgi:hypothetical protein